MFLYFLNSIGHGVYFDEGGAGAREYWCVMLNQTNLAQNNNKYYFLQLITEHLPGTAVYTFFRWGRVGTTSPNMFLARHDDLECAQAVFCQKFFDKTGSPWEEVW